MSNHGEGKKDIKLNEIFSVIDTKNIMKPFKEYQASLDSFFTEYSPSKFPSLIRFYETFNTDTFSSEDHRFIANALDMANYDESALKGECVLLFAEPLIVSELRCKGVIRNKNEGAIRLIL
ncbi:hypothetical protein AB4140_18825 [Shewanella sp. 10N.286.51.B2]|uniref:hypothetical protein n=1 Tax=Shewanella sp. 10N.286.51.B2 TaxID=3229707 RepID=UPI00354DE89B